MKNKTDQSFETKCIHAGIQDYDLGPVTPPIYQTSTFRFKSAQHGAACFAGEDKGYIYTRMGNPTIEAMEDCVAALEGGYKALGCASGMAAIHTVFAGSLEQGDHIVCSQTVYGPTTTLLSTIMNKFGIETTFVDTTDVEAVKKSVKPNTKMLYVETPGNPTLSITDLSEMSKIAKSANALLVVDNTFMSPALQSPFDYNADMIVHSMTKFLNGHADVVGGIIIVKDEPTYKKFRKILNQLGGVIDPFNSFLVHRGIKTLFLRMKKHCENAQVIAEHLEQHPEIKWVMYPGLKSHPQYELGQKQFKGSGGMITFELKGGFEAGRIMMNSVKLCQLAVSLGGVESLIEHPASMTHLSMGPAARLAGGITEGLVRFSVGIENVQELIADLDQALEKVKEGTVR